MMCLCWKGIAPRTVRLFVAVLQSQRILLPSSDVHRTKFFDVIARPDTNLARVNMYWKFLM